MLRRHHAARDTDEKICGSPCEQESTWDGIRDRDTIRAWFVTHSPVNWLKQHINAVNSAPIAGDIVCKSGSCGAKHEGFQKYYGVQNYK